jgi:L-ascorbate metabolism protein UlaG (beta-lactamase superfamily)
MDIEYKGANAILLSTKQATVAVDPKLSSAGLKDITGKFAVELATQEEFIVPKEDALVISSPGEYEVKGVSVKGIAAQRHIDTPDDGKKAVIYKVTANDITLGIIGHVVTPLTEEQLESLGMLDVLVIPIGGNGYTLDAHEATQVVRQINPKVVIPTYYSDTALKYEVPPQDLEPFVKEMGVPHEAIDKLKLKALALPASTTIFEVTRSS